MAVRYGISQEWFERGQRVIPGCSQTFSKGWTQFTFGASPIFLRSGKGCRVIDVDGNEYVDYPMALGPIVLGHNYPRVSEAVRRQMDEGTTFSLPHPLEVQVAETLVEIVPCAEMVRFAKNGSDATSGAVRLARAFTGREIIACCGYHGWQDWYIGTTTRNKGVPKAVQDLTIPFEYNNIASLERIFAEHSGQVAAVIMEPVGVIEPEQGFLERIRELTRREGALLIFDEIITGFRLALGGAQEYFGVIPDLACFGKAMGNGYPISAVVGRREIMQLFDEVFFSFTFGGETVSLAAALATISEMRKKNVISHLWEQGQKLKDGYNVLAREFGVDRYTECIGLPPRTVVTFKDETGSESLVLKSLFQQECLKRGVLFSGGHNVCYSHSNADIDHTLRAYRAATEIMAEAIRSGDPLQRLEGKPVQAVFRQA
ncbi:MAG TPA: aminotransferase class III-fold pyridoxal phosphate-dependent enzyme [Anaerolineales bacterium]|nr:aminotransferase class III-fold pyridoxal phosphate-dependent enzyme [Anaerolineales bacterium]